MRLAVVSLVDGHTQVSSSIEPRIQTSMEQGSWIEYYPLTTVTDGSPIEFDVSGTGEDYIDFANSMLYVQAKVTTL